MSDEISTKQFLKEFAQFVDYAGGIESAATYWDMSESFIRSVRSGSNLPGKRILDAMKLSPVKEIKYRYKRLR